MLKLLLLLSTVVFLQTSIYTYSIHRIDGSEINFTDFQGKKILIVNIATNSPRVGQLQQLEQLHQLYHDSLVIIAFPSNSFGREPMTNAGIDSFCHATYDTHFLVAEKNAVTGSEQQVIYQWLSSQSLNGVTNAAIQGDFQKFLIDGNGHLVGLFASTIEPMNALIRDAVTDNN